MSVGEAVSPSAIDFANLYDAYQPMLMARVRRWVRDPEFAADIVQETFVRGFRARETLDPSRSPLPWLLRIASNLCIDLGRQATRQAARVVNVPVDADLFDKADADCRYDPEAIYVDAELSAETRAMLASLSDRQRRVLIGHAAGRTCAELACQEGMSVAGLKSLLVRTRRSARERYFAFTSNGLPTAISTIALRIRMRIRRRLNSTPWHTRIAAPQMATFLPAIVVVTAGIASGWIGPRTLGGTRLGAGISHANAIDVTPASYELSGWTARFRGESTTEDNSQSQTEGLDAGASIGGVKADLGHRRTDGPNTTESDHIALRVNGIGPVNRFDFELSCTPGPLRPLVCGLVSQAP